MHRPPPPDEASGTAPSNHTDNTADLAKQLFDEEVAVLESQATIKAFINVIAVRRVKQRLRQLGKPRSAQSAD
jgi:hypothetical protein